VCPAWGFKLPSTVRRLVWGPHAAILILQMSSYCRFPLAAIPDSQMALLRSEIILASAIAALFLGVFLFKDQFKRPQEPIRPTRPIPSRQDTLASVASDITGVASVIDGGTIEIHGTPIRLEGIDAPESGQQCEADGQNYPCGQRAAFALSDMLTQHTVTCQVLGHDRFSRTIGRCFAGSQDVQRALVRAGWAIAYRRYSKDYVADEEAAHAARVGIWAGTFIAPEKWRREKRDGP
jgi:endonuclease YncB( thermonuclease family)